MNQIHHFSHNLINYLQPTLGFLQHHGRKRNSLGPMQRNFGSKEKASKNFESSAIDLVHADDHKQVPKKVQPQVAMNHLNI